MQRHALSCLAALGLLAAGCGHAGLQAAQQGDLVGLKAWLDSGPQLEDPVGPRGGTVVHAAALAGQAEAVALLLSRGAKPDAVDEGGDTPLCLVARQKEPKNGSAVAAALLANKADPNLACGGEVPLHHAAAQYSWDVAREILQRGGKLAHPYDKAAEPLSLAALSARADVVGLLLKSGVDPDIHETAAIFDALNTPQKDSTQVVSLLVKAGANLGVRQKGDGTGDTALHRLVILRTYGADGLVDLMVKHGADTYAVNDQGLLPLDTALEKSESIAARMIKHMADQLPEKGSLKAAYDKVTVSEPPAKVLATLERVMALAGYIHTQAKLLRTRGAGGVEEAEAKSYEGIVNFAGALMGALANSSVSGELTQAAATDALQSLSATTREELADLAADRERQKLPESPVAARIKAVMEFVLKLQRG
jgi:ankyrin repeat protein